MKARKIEYGSEIHLVFVCLGCNEDHHVPIVGQHPWGFNGSLEKPTLTPSVKVSHRHPKGHSNDNPAPADFSGEYVTEICHSFVREGRIEYLSDCTHHLAGKTIELPPVDNV